MKVDCSYIVSKAKTQKGPWRDIQGIGLHVTSIICGSNQMHENLDAAVGARAANSSVPNFSPFGGQTQEIFKHWSVFWPDP